MVKKAKAQPKKKVAATGHTRQLTKKQAKEKAKVQAKKEALKRPALKGSFSLTKQVFISIRRFWKPLGGIVLVYLILNVVLASGLLSNLNTVVGNIRTDLNGSHQLSKALSGYSSLLGGSSGGSQSSSAIQSVLLVLESLVIIWALRQLLAGEKVRVKQAYYHSMAPLIPFLLVAAMIIIQLLPLTLGTALLALILSSTVTSGILLTVIFAILFGLLAAWSVYMVSSSIFALYIVTLPDMEPRQALRSAKHLVRFRRWFLLRRLLFLPILVLIIMGVITVPLILVIPFLVAPVFFILLMLTVLFAHTYLYSLYRELIA